MITDLRCERYIDLYLRFRAASNRFKAHSANDYNEVLSKLVMSELEPEPVLDMAITRGFKQLWLEKKKTTNQGTKRHIRDMLSPGSPQAPLALENGPALAPLALESGAPAPSTGPVQPGAEALQQEINNLKEQLLRNQVSNLKDELARARQRVPEGQSSLFQREEPVPAEGVSSVPTRLVVRIT